MLTQLPNGIVEGQDLFNFVELDELRGKQQNYLADKELVVGNIGHIPKILQDMILSLQTKEGVKWQGKVEDAVNKLPSGDIETILIKIRENTYGPRFYHEGVCTHCNHVNKNLRLDLDGLKIDYMPVEQMLKPKVIKLPKCGQEVELKPPYLKDLFEIIKITKNNHNTLFTSLLRVTIKRFGKKSGVTEQDIENIPASDILVLQKEVEKMKLEGGIDTDIEINCSNCNKDFTIKLNCFDASFFDLTRGSTNTNT